MNDFNQQNQVCHYQRLYQINMIAGVSNLGECFFTLNKGKTNSKTFIYFLTKLITHLNGVDKNWRKNTVLMIDNAPYHRSKFIRDRFEKLNLPLMFLGPYQFKMAPAEHLFAFVKKRDLNPLHLKAYSKGDLVVYLKELGLYLGQQDYDWIAKSFYYMLTFALEAIAQKDL